MGRGAGFNPGEGSTSAFFVDSGELFLIDSGESVFLTLMKRNIFTSVSKLHIFITHTHSDHVGSLGTVILYAFAVLKIKVNIIIDKNMGYLPSIRALFKIYGLTEDMYDFVDASAYSGSYSLFNKVRYFKTIHCDELKSCGIIFETEKGIVFYSGDMNNPAPLLKVVKSGEKIDKIYIDSDNHRKPSRHHISIHHLNDFIPPALKPKVHCMHFNNEQCMAEAKAYGFKIVKRI